MGAFDFLKKSELAEIDRLKYEIVSIGNQLTASVAQSEMLQQELENAKAELCRYASIVNVEKERDRVIAEVERYKSIKEDLIQQEGILKEEIEVKKSQIVELDEIILRSIIY